MATECKLQKEIHNAVLNSWLFSFKKALNYDSIGERDKAAIIYKWICSQIENDSFSTKGVFNHEEKKFLMKFSTSMTLRLDDIMKTEADSNLTLQDMQSVADVFQKMKNGENKTRLAFPFEVISVPTVTFQLKEDCHLDNTDNDGNATHNTMDTSRGTILSAPPSFPGKTTLNIFVEKITMKNCMKYIDPYVSISVCDQNGINVSVKQETPKSTTFQTDCILFNQNLYIQKPLEFLPLGFAIIFEFRHFKSKKNQFSTKCWSFLERDDLDNGENLTLELYKKPVVSNRNKIRLFSDKPDVGFYISFRLLS